MTEEMLSVPAAAPASESPTPEQRMKALGIELPDEAGAAADYVPCSRANGLLLMSGQTPRVGGQVALRGTVGSTVSLAEAQAAARICALRLLTIARRELGSLDLVERVVELVVYVRSADDFEDQSAVADAASALFVSVFGEKGRHARSAVGVLQLPRGAAVEVSAVMSVATP